MAGGSRYVVHEMSQDYGERRWAIEDLAIQRDNLVRHWRQRGKGRVYAHGVKPPKTGMIWRGTKTEAEDLCREMNKVSKLGELSVASDPPTRANAREWAKARATTTHAGARSMGHSAAATRQAALFTLCRTCSLMHKPGKCKQ